MEHSQKDKKQGGKNKAHKEKDVEKKKVGESEGEGEDRTTVGI